MEDNSLKKIKSIASDMLALYQTCGIQFDDETEELATELETRVTSECFNVMVLGTFSRGKSMFLNALLGRKLLYESPNESTGAITFIRNSEKRHIYVTKGNSTLDFPIDDSSYNKMVEIVNIKNPDSSATIVHMDYPLYGFDEDITFMDTPGLNGLGREQIVVTKKAMSVADAVIMIVSYVSLDIEELKLILGENEAFGKIKPQKLILVISKIGLLLNNTPREQEEAKLERVRNEILKQLKDGGADQLFSEICIYAVDSVYYLASVDDAAYSEINTSENALSREEMRRISRFDELKTGLMKFLESSNRIEQTRMQLSELTSTFARCMTSYIDKLTHDETLCRTESREKLNIKLERSYANKRKVLAKIAVYIREQIDTLNINLTEYQKQQFAEINKDCAIYIYDNIKDISDCNSDSYHMVTSYAEKKNAAFSAALSEKLNKFYSVFSNELAVHTEKSFNETYGSNISVNNKLEIEEVSLKNTKLQETNFASDIHQIDEEIKQKQQELDCTKRSILSLQEKIEQLKIECDRKEIQIKAEHQKNLDRLGKRPNPKEIVWEEPKQVKVFLFFTKTVYEKHKRLDYTNVEAYDKRKQAIMNEYTHNLDEINVDVCKLSEYACKLDSEKRNIQFIELEISDLKRSRELEERRYKEKLERAKEKLVDHFKQELTIKLEFAVKKAMDDMLSSVIVTNGRICENLIRKTNEYVELYANDFKNKLQKQIDEIGFEYNVDYAQLNERLTTLVSQIN